MTTKQEVSESLKDTLNRLNRKGIRAEHIAVTVGVSYSAVKKWMYGLRVPGKPTLARLESIYGVKIL